ncbi:G2/mitotic-specific cyclin, partial [Physocladia obscura]
IQTRRSAALANKINDQENITAAAKSVKEIVSKSLHTKQSHVSIAAAAKGVVAAAKQPLIAKKQPLGAVHQVQNVQPATTKVAKLVRTRSASAKKNVSDTAKSVAKTTAAQVEAAKIGKPCTTASVDGVSENKSTVVVARNRVTRMVAARSSVSNLSGTAPTATGAATIAEQAKTRSVKVKKSMSEIVDVEANVVNIVAVKNEPSAVAQEENISVAGKFAAVDVAVAEPAQAREWDDLDSEDACDPMMLSEYVVEIFEYMRELEVSVMPNPQYMESQKELKWSMRDILVDWLIDIHNKFRLLPETLYLAVNIIDRFLSLRVVSLVKLQLVGITSMFIAAKYEEVIAPSIKNFIFMADGGYTEEEIQKAERYVLSVLEFNLQYPSSMSFLRRCSKAENYNIETRTLAKYLMEISLVDHRFLDIYPSHVAAAGLYLARRMLNQGLWDANLAHYSGYTEDAILPVSDLMIDYLHKPCKHEAFFKKYTSKKFMKAAPFVREWISKNSEL